MYAIAAAIQSGSTVNRMLHTIPHDASAVLIYVRVIAFITLIVLGNRKKS
jgi:hypothetical protein